MVTFVEADAPRVRCPDHSVVVASVPWAGHGARHPWAFDQQVAWLAVNSSKAAITQLTQIAWRTFGAIVARVVAAQDQARAAAGRDRLDGLAPIGIDEISYQRGQKYVVIVVDPGTDRAGDSKNGQLRPYPSASSAGIIRSHGRGRWPRWTPAVREEGTRWPGPIGPGVGSACAGRRPR
jgi:transposase